MNARAAPRQRVGCRSVWSADPLRAAEVAEKLEAGTVWVNTHMQLTHDAPFTGVKHSGLGSEMGLAV
jgi:acyl-CoA reductase-like NAD-dependent aldehyde dehydrogenase